ncbi:MAG: hypothetical protein A2149_06225 [Candidatus Schekmanbacteria bacterium RBG_16_38_11]|uniref:Periplasmic chaperone PpiD n=1 Tax=Candidatus Schekmanbacteria bacterium RBG_16_38_11 TaxID=1817880 RepID=A0A1F7RQW1_9BACT|nr:MAG: hypothetical protein A2149_06225 [Candidatus Schekmanbacteria bacterium RBG_16_38_11]
MLDAMRKNVKSLSIFLWLVIISFIAFYGVTNRNPSETNSVAVVNGERIPFSAYREEYFRTQEFFRNLLKENAEEYLKNIDLKKMTLDRLVEKTLLLQTAKKLGIGVTDEELVNRLKNFDVFLNERGVLDNDRIVSILEKNRIEPKKFIENLKQDILIEKMRKFIGDMAKVSSAQVRDEYMKRNEKIEAEYVFVPNDYYKNDVNVKEADLKNYFEKNKEAYRLPKREKIKYIFIESKNFAKDATVSEDEIKNYYKKNTDTYKAKAKQVRARHILFSLKPGTKKEQEDALKKKAENVLKEAKSGKDFVTLVKIYSDEPMAALRGGDLGYFQKGAMVPEFEKTAFSLNKGEVSDLVKTSFGYHIIKVEDILEPGDTVPLDYVKDEVRERIISEKGKKSGLAKASEVYQEWSRKKPGEKLEEIKGNKIISTEFENGKALEGIGKNPDIQKIVSKVKEGELAKPFFIERGEKGWVILQKEKEIPSSIPSFEEVKDRVARDLRTNMSAQLVDEKMKEWAKELKGNVSLKKIIDNKGIVVKETGEISRSSNMQGIRDQEDFKGLAFSLSENKPVVFFKVGDGYFLLKLVKKIPIDEKDFEKQKDELRKNLLESERNRIFTEELKNLRAQAKIETYKEIM